jgi:hypothetical protein
VAARRLGDGAQGQGDGAQGQGDGAQGQGDGAQGQGRAEDGGRRGGVRQGQGAHAQAPPNKIKGKTTNKSEMVIGQIASAGEGGVLDAVVAEVLLLTLTEEALMTELAAAMLLRHQRQAAAMLLPCHQKEDGVGCVEVGLRVGMMRAVHRGILAGGDRPDTPMLRQAPAPGTHFICFPSTKVQIVAQEWQAATQQTCCSRLC